MHPECMSLSQPWVCAGFLLVSGLNPALLPDPAVPAVGGFRVLVGSTGAGTTTGTGWGRDGDGMGT